MPCLKEFDINPKGNIVANGTIGNRHLLLADMKQSKRKKEGKHSDVYMTYGLNRLVGASSWWYSVQCASMNSILIEALDND